MNISLSPFASEKLVVVARDGFGRPVSRQSARSQHSEVGTHIDNGGMA